MNKRNHALILLLLLVAACGDDEVVDPRLGLEGTYRLQQLEYSYADVHEGVMTNDSTVSLTTGPRIRLKATDSSPNKMEIDFEELIEDTMGYFSPMVVADIRVESKYPTMITLTGNSFSLDQSRFNLVVADGATTGLARAHITMDGQVAQDELQFDFEVFIGGFAGGVLLKGSASGEKE